MRYLKKFNELNESTSKKKDVSPSMKVLIENLFGNVPSTDELHGHYDDKTLKFFENIYDTLVDVNEMLSLSPEDLIVFGNKMGLGGEKNMVGGITKKIYNEKHQGDMVSDLKKCIKETSELRKEEEDSKSFDVDDLLKELKEILELIEK
jgi:hypothetical protein